MIEPTDPREEHRAEGDVGTGGAALSPEATRQVLHDLRVHQIELELQNEELRRTHLALEASRSRYFDLYDLAPVGYVSLRQSGTIQEANLTVATLLGVAPGALVDQPLTRFILPADQDIFYQHQKQLFNTGARQVCELRIARSDGATCWVRLEATTAEKVEGVRVHRTVVSDISARKRAEETLRASEARHRILFEQSHDALMTLAPPDWRFTSGNATTLAMFGVPDAEHLLARAPRAFWPERQSDGSVSVERAELLLETAMREGSVFYEWTFLRASGEQFPATVLLTRLEIDGQPLIQATVRDETEAKKLQAMLAQADRLASMGMLAGSVAHEINNPLAYAIHRAETLADELPKLAVNAERSLTLLRANVGDEVFEQIVGGGQTMLAPSVLNEMVEHVREALAGMQRIKHITRSIGAFSRVESGEPAHADLNYAIECAAKMTVSDIKFRAELVLDLGRLPAVSAAEGKLSQVFLNLLMNAAQAIEVGHVRENRIAVRTWASDGQVFAEVRDTGKGIAPANLARIFDPFFTTKAVGVGSGLGLSICRNILAEFGGDIRVNSVPGQGTRFLVCLPSDEHATAALAPEATVNATPPTTRGRILVVDDEPAITAMVLRVLGPTHEFVTATSGEAARAVLKHDQAFDVILCDLMMPDITGAELHAWLAVQFPLLAERVVFASGGAFEPKTRDYLSRIANTVLEKPYPPSELRAIVSRMIAAKRGA